MRIIKFSGSNESAIISKAIRSLRNQGLIIYPTETCYGLGADATDHKAIDKVFSFKGHRREKPISIAVANKQMAEKYVQTNQTAENIYRHLLPGPITVVSQSLEKVDPRLETDRKTLGIRIPAYPLILKLIKTFGKPITSTSANVSGGKTPYSIESILSQVSERKKRLIDIIIDAGKLPHRLPSSVVDTTLNMPTLLRQGEINFSQLGTKSIITNSPHETQEFARQFLRKNLSILKKRTLLFALQGQLGAGKTQFAKGLGQGLKISHPITSPTFIIVKEYPYQFNGIKGVFYHIDAWRTASFPTSLEFIKEYLQPGNIIAIEWIQKGKEVLEKLSQNSKAKIIWVEIKHLDQTKRRIRFTD